MPDQNSGVSQDRLNDLLGLLGAGGVAGGAAKAIVPFAVGKKLLPSADYLTLPQGVKEQLRKQGQDIDPYGVGLNLWRYQKPAQAERPALSSGVFYGIHGGDPDAAHYYNMPNRTWGGSDLVQGKTFVKNPLIVHGPWGSIGERGLRELYPKDAEIMNYDINHAAWELSKGNLKPYQNFMMEYAPNEHNLPTGKALHPDKGVNYDRAITWLKESAVASKARKEGYDSIINYGPTEGFFGAEGRGKPAVSELFDLRERTYPTVTTGAARLWPQHQQVLDIIDSLKNPQPKE